MKVSLSTTSNREYHPGKSVAFRLLWIFVEALTLLNPLLLPSDLKCRILRAFGASIGNGVTIKPNVHIKHPWRLTVGDHCWIGERSWIDNLVPVTIGSNVCISQGAYLCTGNHDWSDPGMGMTPQPIVVEDGAWIGAFAKVGPGVTVGTNAVLVIGAVLLRNSEPHTIYRGNPAQAVRRRTLRDTPGPRATHTRSH